MPQERNGRFAVIVYAVFLGCVTLAGGASRIDAASQPVVRLAALALMAALVIKPGRLNGPTLKPALWFMAAITAVIVLQLIPLPPEVWSRLPGRARYLIAATAAGEPQPWRPINLTPDRGWNALFALLPPLATLAAMARLSIRRQPVILAAFAIMVVASAFVGLVQISSGNERLHFYAVSSPGSAVGLFANRNHQALLLCCGIPMLALWGARGTASLAGRRMRALIAIGAIGFLILMIPATGSRAGLALGLVALPLALALAWPAVGRAARSLSRRQRRGRGMGAIALFVALIGVALTFARAEAVRRLFQSDPIDDARVRLLRPLLDMIHSFFPVGTGFGSFDPVYRGFEPFQDLALTYMVQAHDDYLQLVLEAGLAGLLLLLAFVGWWAWTSARLWRRPYDEAGGLGRLGSALLLLIMLASLVDYPLRTPIMMVMAAQAASWMMMARPPKGSAAPQRGFNPENVVAGAADSGDAGNNAS